MENLCGAISLVYRPIEVLFTLSFLGFDGLHADI